MSRVSILVEGRTPLVSTPLAAYVSALTADGECLADGQRDGQRRPARRDGGAAVRAEAVHARRRAMAAPARASTTISYPVKNLTNQRFLEHCIALQLRSWGHALLIMVQSGVQMSLQAQRCNGHHDNGQVVERQSGHA